MSNASNPLISCIIPTYKRNDTLLRAIQSVLNQTYSTIELIVVDDNEPNDSYSIQVQKLLQKVDDNRVKYLPQEKHKNGAAARNFGVYNSKGAYVAFLDDDDEWEKNKLEEQLKCLVTLDPTYGAVSCLSYICKNNEIIGKTEMFSEDELEKNIFERQVEFNTSTVLFNKDKLINSGIFNENLSRHQDLQLFIDFLEKYKIKPMSKVLIKYHVDDDINRPNSSKLIDIKKNFFKEMASVLKQYSNKERRDIYAAHYFEIINAAYKEKNLKIILHYLIKVGINLSAYIKLFRRIKSRTKKN